MIARLSPRQRQAAPIVIGLVIFVVALAVLRIEIRNLAWHTVVADVLGVPRERLALAAGLTILSYAALTGYDLLAFAYVGRRISRVRIAAASLFAYAVSNTIGFAMLTGASVRYRFYARWGVTAEEMSRIVLAYSVSFWLGLFALGGASLIARGSAIAGPASARHLIAPAGWLLILIPALYVAATVMRRDPIRLFTLEITLPRTRVAVLQLGISSLDWALAAAVLYVLLPAGSLTFMTFLGLFLIAILLGLVSHVPGGVGVFEGVLVWLLAPYLPSGEVIPALVVFRVMYYLVPLCLALGGLILDEAWQRRDGVTRVAAGAGRITAQLTPPAMAALTFIAGIVLLVSGATPAAPDRLARVNEVFPLGVIELSHFAGSVAGAALLVISQGLARRLDTAYYLTVGVVVAGMAASLLKGFDYEEAALLLVVLGMLWAARPAFGRRAAFLDTRFSASWLAALIAAITASVWLGLFAYQHVDYSHALWWQFELQGDASRFLRASVGAAMVVLLAGLARLVRHAPHDAPVPSDADLDDAARIIAAQGATSPMLVFLRDKSLLFNPARTAFVMYAVQGRSWVALGDPVGPPDQRADLVRLFLERCDDFGGVPVFYEIGAACLHAYADFGLRFLKIGEEARVDLTRFSLEGGAASRYRQALKRVEKAGCVFRILPAADVAARLPELRAVSDQWLALKSTAEKGFSLGFFDETYLARFPVAVIERGTTIVAFANIWTAGGRGELSIDLMRYGDGAPAGIMESLIVHVMQWGQQHGFRQFVLGMAPLSGFESSAVATLWNRLGAFVYAHGDALYHFRGLRAFKEKFASDWEPHYLAYPGGLRLPRILADVSALVAGGYGQIFKK